jgi:hypothetical protein
MIEFIVTIDYELFGNGGGSLRNLVYDPTQKLVEIFEKHEKRFVVFVEVAELEKIEQEETDSDIRLIKKQIQNLHKNGFELGLHIHPGWYNASYHDGSWHIDYSEYNLSRLPKDRIAQTIDRAISYLRKILLSEDFTPFCFRAGHLLFQPSSNLSRSLSERGIKVDTSLYKGGLMRQQDQDYRQALKNGYYWRFTDNINKPDSSGILLELPIYTQTVPTWKMLTTKRVGIQAKGASASQTSKRILSRLMDYMRLRYPLKLDLAQTTIAELKCIIDTIIRHDRLTPKEFKPIVAIGHTKEFVDFENVDTFLSYLEERGIAVSTIKDAYEKCSLFNVLRR